MADTDSSLHQCVDLAADIEEVAAFLAGMEDVNVVNSSGETALFSAVKRSTEYVRLLCDAGVDPSIPRTCTMGDPALADDSTPLMAMIANPFRSGLDVAILLAHGADPNYRRSRHFGRPDDASALDLACGLSKANTARLLVEAGADVTYTQTLEGGSRHDVSPLMYAACFDTPDVMEMVLDRGADVNYVSSYRHGEPYRRSALFRACENFAEESNICLLCRRGADATAVFMTAPSRTALHELCIDDFHSPEARKALVTAGADPWEVNDEGQTVAEVLGYDDIFFDSRPSTVDFGGC